MSNHAMFPPSSMGRLVKCAASWSLSALFPEQEDSEAAREGTAAHWVAQCLLTTGERVQAGTLAPNGAMVDEEMIEAVDEYVAALETTAGTLEIERPVRIPRVHADCWGMPDAYSLDWAHRRLFVGDFKYGHRYVEVFENYQLMAYAAGVLDEHQLDDQEWTIDFLIVQPRCYSAAEGPVRWWRGVPASDLRAHVNIMRMACENALLPSPVQHAGPHCRDCPGRIGCTASLRAGEEARDVVLTAAPLELPPEALGVELRYLRRARDTLEARIAGLEEQAATLMASGTRVPHFAMQPTYGRQRWAVPVNEVLELGFAMGKNLAKPDAAVITPKQAIKLGIDEAVISAYSETPRGPTKLIPENTINARKVFGSHG